jgi:signal transduction histidine kinase
VVTIDVRDTGRGIPREEHERIFEPFLQVEDASATLGAGLGLAIARRLSVLMDGMLTVESTVGAGSTFRLTLPVAAPV